MAPKQPKIEDPVKPAVAPTAPASGTPPTDPTPDMTAVMSMLQAIKKDTGQTGGILASLTAAASLPGKIDEMIDLVKASPGATVPDIMSGFEKLLAGKPTPEGEKKSFSVGDFVKNTLQMGGWFNKVDDKKE